MRHLSATTPFPLRRLLTLVPPAVPFLAATCLAGPLAAAQLGGGQRAETTLYTRIEGDVIRAAVEIEIERGWHLYHDDLGHEKAVGKPTEISFAGGGEIAWSDPLFPEPHPLDQSDIAGPGAFINAHEGTIVVYAAGRLSGGAAGGDGAQELEVRVNGLTCQDDGSCVLLRDSAGSSGRGPDALFDAFPASLAPPSPPGAPTGGAASGREPAGASESAPSLAEAEGHAAMTLYTRREGDVLRAALRFTVEPGWHLYHDELGHEQAIGKPTVVTFEGGGEIAWSEPRFPPPERLDQSDVAGPGTFINAHEGTFVVYAAGRVLEGGGDSLEPSARANGLTCQDDGSCVLFKASAASAGAGPDALFAAFPADLVAPAAPAPSETPPEREDSPPPGDVEESVGDVAPAGTSYTDFPDFRPQREAPERSLAVWLLFAFLAGAILNVMPCVLPVISIKVLSFVQQAGESRARVFQLGLSFAAGILIVFLVLAGAAIALEQSWGEQFQSQTFLIAMIGIVFAFALSLFGVYEIGVPAQVGAMAGLSREGLGDAFFKGMLATVLATPCSGPFLGSTLTWTLSQSPSVIFGIFAMLGLGMAFPYVILTANPAFLRLVPRPGAWMETFKQCMGFLLLATVVYLMVSLRQDLLLYTVAFLVFVGLGCWWWGRFAKFDQSRLVRLSHLGAAVALVALGGRLAFVDLRGLFEIDAGEDHVAWVDFDRERFLAHLSEGRTVFVDFTADWCPNCKYNEAFVFNSRPVRELIEAKNVVPMAADMTEDEPVIESLLRALGGRSIPYLAVFPGDRPHEPFVLPDVVTVSDMVEIFEACPDPAVARLGRG